jgi:hypothetical protein
MLIILNYSIPASVNPQDFMQKHCDISSVKSQDNRYKIEFKIFASDAGSLVKAGCHIEEQGDTFKHIWTRICIKDDTKDSWRDINIICPGRYTLMYFF